MQNLRWVKVCSHSVILLLRNYWRNSSWGSLNPKWKEKVMNEWMLRKAIQELAHAYHLAFLSQANRTYSTLTRHLEAVIIEVSSVQVLRLRASQQEVHNAKSPPSIGIYVAAIPTVALLWPSYRILVSVDIHNCTPLQCQEPKFRFMPTLHESRLHPKWKEKKKV